MQRISLVCRCETRRLENQTRVWESEAKRLRKELNNATVHYADKCMDNIELRKDIKSLEKELALERKRYFELQDKLAKTDELQPTTTERFALPDQNHNFTHPSQRNTSTGDGAPTTLYIRNQRQQGNLQLQNVKLHWQTRMAGSKNAAWTLCDV